MSSLEKMREAFERNLAKKLNMTYEEVKARMDEYEKITGYRYGKNGQNSKDWAIWCEAWQSRQAEVDELSSQNQILKEVAESDTKTIERLESVINLNDSELKDKDKRIDVACKSINSFFDNQVSTPTPREYANFIAEILEALRGEHD